MGSCSFCYVLLLYAIMGKLFCVSGKHRDEQQGCGIFVNAVFFDIYFIHIKLFGLSWRNQRNSYIYISLLCSTRLWPYFECYGCDVVFMCVCVWECGFASMHIIFGYICLFAHRVCRRLYRPTATRSMFKATLAISCLFARNLEASVVWFCVWID